MEAALRGVLPTRAGDGAAIASTGVDTQIPVRAVGPMAEPPRGRVFGFAAFRVDMAEERVWRGEEELKLRRKPFAILRQLVERPGRLVTQRELVDAVWGRVAMSESLLRTHVHELRRVLGHGFVETVAGRGYRFVAAVHEMPRPIPTQAPHGARSMKVEAEPSVHFVGRTDELQVLRHALDQTRMGRRQIVLIEGEAGAGKTALVDRFLSGAEATGAVTVARGACIEQFGANEAYLPFLSALGGLYRAPSDAEGHLLLELARSVEAFASEQPLVVALDDLQWVDHSTVELLANLARRREPAQLLVIGTYRSGEVAKDRPFYKVASELIGHKQATSMTLQRFTPAELTDYARVRFGRNAFPEDFLRTIHCSTGGNPLFVAALFDDLEQRETIRRVGDEWRLMSTVEEVAARRPESIRRLLDIQIDRLAPREQRILEAASLVGATFVTGLVASALEIDAGEVHAACESLARDGQLLRVLGTEAWPDGTMQPRFAFAHMLHWHAAKDRIGPRVGRMWHLRIAERLESGLGERIEGIVTQVPARLLSELAAHFDAGEARVKAARYYLLAGEHAQRMCGVNDAERYFDEARMVLHRIPSGTERDELEAQLTTAGGPS